MFEFPVKPLMTIELVKLLLLERPEGGIISFEFSPLLHAFKLAW